MILDFYSSSCPDLTLVDLPGITKNPVEGQTEETIAKIDAIVKDYIKQPNTIILAVGQASIDVASFESLQIARAVDPEGERTIGVVTKIDSISEDSKDMINTLEGNLYQLTEDTAFK